MKQHLSGVGMTIGFVVALVASPLAKAAKTEVPCSEVPLAFNLPGFELKCEKRTADPVEYKVARGLAASGNRWMLDFLLASHPLDADTYGLNFSADQAEGWVFFSTAHTGHGLEKVDLRRAEESTYAALIQLQLKVTISWHAAAMLDGWEIQSYRLVIGVQGKPKECFAFARYADPSSDKYRQRLLGDYCAWGVEAIDDATASRVLRAISTR